MDQKSLRLECLQLAVEGGEPLSKATERAQQLILFVLGLDGSVAPDGVETLGIEVK